MAHLLYHILGFAGTGSYYGFWSGFGSDISEFAVFLGIIGLIKKHQCHQAWCWRFGHYKEDEQGTVKCRKHLS
jgi:hypothetical protein